MRHWVLCGCLCPRCPGQGEASPRALLTSRPCRPSPLAQSSLAASTHVTQASACIRDSGLSPPPSRLWGSSLRMQVPAAFQPYLRTTRGLVFPCHRHAGQARPRTRALGLGHAHLDSAPPSPPHCAPPPHHLCPKHCSALPECGHLVKHTEACPLRSVSGIPVLACARYQWSDY